MNIQTFTEFLETAAAAIQGSAKKFVNLTVGSVMRAFIEACSQMAMTLQFLIAYVSATTRLSTSTGSAVDTFVEDFNLEREGAIAASGTVDFSRKTATAAAYIDVGAQVQTQDGSQVFSVIADTSNASFDSTTQQYTIAAGVSSLGILVEADTPGTGGNVQGGAINTLTSAISGVDSVSNPSAFTNGKDQETDDALKARFALYLQGLKEATSNAVGAAIEDMQQGLSYTITENQDQDGTQDYGFFYIVVDDGTGSPPTSTLDSVYSAVDAIRGLSIRFAVYAPTIVAATVALTVTTTSTANATTVKDLVQTAIENYINNLPLGSTLYYTRLAQVAYDASSDVVNVSGLTINGGTADLPATSGQVIKYNTVTVT